MAKKSNFQKGMEFFKRQKAKLKGSGKRQQMGLGGRVGASIAGLGGLAVSGIGATTKGFSWLSSDRADGIDKPSAILASVYLFFNNLSSSYIGGPIFDKMDITLNNGSSVKNWNIGSVTNVPPWTGWKLAGVGGSMMGVDRFLGWLAGHGVNVPGTRTRAIGTY